MLDEVFLYFLGSQGGSHGRVWDHTKFICYYATIFREIAEKLFDAVFLMGTLAYV